MKFIRWIMTTFGVVIGTLVIVAICVLLSAGTAVIGLKWQSWFAPQQNQVQYQVFNTSPQHIQAVVTQITNYCEQRASAPNDLQKAAIDESIYQAQKGTPLHEADMPAGVWTCYNQAVSYELNGGQP